MLRAVSIVLGFTVLAFGLNAWLFETTKERREAALMSQQRARIATLVPAGAMVEPPAIELPRPATMATRQLIHGDDGDLLGWMFGVRAPNGYAGPIDLLVAVDINQQILGVEIVSHRETPGLGDRVERDSSDWLRGFDRRTLAQSDWHTTRYGGDIDGVTGATVTSEAIIVAVAEVLAYVAAHHACLVGIDLAAQPGAGPTPGALPSACRFD